MKLGLLLGLLLTLAAAPPPPETRQETDLAVRTMHDFSACIVGRRGAVMRLLRLEPGTPEENRLMLTVANPDCLPGGDSEEGSDASLRFKEHLFRGGLYEALYRGAFPNPPAGFESVPPLAYRWTDPGGETQRRIVNRQRAAYGECVARDAPAGVHALLQTEVTRAGEQAAFAALMPHLSACLPAGSALRFSTPVLRGILAEAIYQLSVATRGPTQ